MIRLPSWFELLNPWKIRRVRDSLRIEMCAIVVFAEMHIDDHFDRLEFLRAWQDGSAATDPEWIDWQDYLSQSLKDVKKMRSVR